MTWLYFFHFSDLFYVCGGGEEERGGMVVIMCMHIHKDLSKYTMFNSRAFAVCQGNKSEHFKTTAVLEELIVSQTAAAI